MIAVPADGAVVWTPDPSAVASSALARFVESVGIEAGTADTADYHAVWQWSIEDPAAFWSAIAADAGIEWTDQPSTALADATMPGATWFPGGTLNYVDLALRRRDGAPAVIFQREDGSTTTLSWHDLAEQVRLAAAGLTRLGVTTGDRVAAYIPSRPETIIAFLATASLGAVWTVTSPDFGERSVLDRFQQVAPKVLFAVSGYTYNGSWHDRRSVVAKLADGLASVEHTIAFPGGEPIGGALTWSELLAPSDAPLATTAVPFDHPLWVVYTSGTTGRPKSIVHGHGGVMLEHHKLVRLHLELTPQDRFFWFSTTGWVMWNILIGGLLAGVPIVIYDGSPAHPRPERLWDLAAETKATFLGLSAAFIQGAMRAGHEPRAGRDLDAVRSIGVTGSPLPAAGYGWLLDQLGEDTFIASISGGTDVATAFVGCTPTLPVRAGALQAACLGVDAVAFDESGQPVVGEMGELVIRQPIPSMPVFFWGDEDGARYRASYFETFPGCWRHGDWVRFDPDGSCVVFGRSDATLNRGGVRMGTGDFYGVLDAMASVADAIAVDTTSAQMPSGRLVLVVQPAEGVVADDAFSAEIRSALRSALSPRHNPDDIIVVERLAHTLNGKRLEVPAKRMFMGVGVGQAADPSAVDDPGALQLLADAASAWRAAQGL
ncbi:MAG: acetoacetate--CoA ligase [Ilumatobacteraceae bacterium]